jgi:hypothetical protein
MRYLIALLTLLAFSSTSIAADAPKAETKKKVTYRKTQEVNFDETDIDGQVRSPDGAYLLQKRGVQFLPLYKVNNQFEKNILESVEYLR